MVARHTVTVLTEISDKLDQMRERLMAEAQGVEGLDRAMLVAVSHGIIQAMLMIDQETQKAALVCGVCGGTIDPEAGCRTCVRESFVWRHPQARGA